jgi:hypothetical protein
LGVRNVLMAALIFSVSLAACSHVPSGAPTVSEFEHPEGAKPESDYFLVDLDPAVVGILANHRNSGLAVSWFAASRA